MQSQVRTLGIVAAALLFLAPPAFAQRGEGPAPEPECVTEPPDHAPEADAAICASRVQGRQILIHNADALARAVAGSFGIGPSTIEPAGLAGLGAAEALRRLGNGTAFVISPAADAATAAATARWNVWGDVKYTWNDTAKSHFDLDGPLWNGLAGFDYKLTDRVTVGLMGSFEDSDLEGIGVETAAGGWGGGPYIGIAVTDHLVFTANVLGTALESELSGFFQFESERLQAAATLNGYWYKDTWRYTPGVSLSWAKEWREEELGLSPDQTIETALVTWSAQLGRTLKIDEHASVEPWLGSAFDWTFVNRIHMEGQPAVDDDTIDVRLQGGLNFAFGSDVQLTLTGEIGGLILGSLDSYAGEANLAIQF